MIKILLNSNYKIKLWFILLLTLLPSLRFFYKYIDNKYSLILYLVYVVTIFFLFENKRISNFFIKNSKWLSPFLLIIFVVIIYFMYPIADGLKESLRGSDQDDCIKLGALDIINWLNPFNNYSYLGNPCSPGIGIVLLSIPLVLFNGYQYFPALLLFLLFFRLKNRNFFIKFLILLMSNLMFIELSVVGSDFVIIGLLLMYLLLIIERVVIKEKFIYFIAILTALILLSTSRLPLLAIPFLVLIFYINNMKRLNMILSFFWICIVLIIIHLPMYFIDEASFLHILSKGNRLLNGYEKIILLASTVIMFLYNLIKNKSIMEFIFWIYSPLFIITTFVDLKEKNSDFSTWEGANYLLVIIPFLIFYILKENNSLPIETQSK